ncbi:MAG TPA: ATP-binding protein, partial [Vicinamibacteria bacterium]|nr:ATP-binding protein [Vicinamibacteria bacterium]
PSSCRRRVSAHLQMSRIRREAAEVLRESEERLKDADRRKDEFLAMLAHELRNPLAPIRTSLELVRLAGDTPEAFERVRTMMERQVGHMIRLVDDLMDVSRISSGKIRLQRQPTALASLVGMAIEANRAALDSKQMSLRVDLPESPAWLDVDATRFVQIVSNVLNNAVKFTEARGHIAIAAQLEPESGLTLTVTDSGAGIDREMLPRVFDFFAQDDAASRVHTGLGIGLALARRLIEMHGGSIEAQSDGHGLGSTFRIRVPVLQGVPAAPPSPPTEKHESTRRVVVIDDNADAANAIAMLVSQLGGECQVAGDGETGLKKVLECRPDLVLLDIRMPGMDGYETCRRIREKLGAGVAVVALTGWGQERDRKKAIRAGFDAHLTKPADPAALERLLSDDSRDPRLREGKTPPQGSRRSPEKSSTRLEA